MYSVVFDLHAQLLKALAHPRRLEIIQLLREEELPVTDIHTMLDLPQANISQHLMILKDAGVVEWRKDGKQIFYSLKNPSISQACDLLREVIIDRFAENELPAEFLLKMKDLVPLTQDPVCHMRLSPKTASYHQTHHHQDYYFCASGCLKKFNENPEKYVH